jgi:hypothetical protein
VVEAEDGEVDEVRKSSIFFDSLSTSCIPSNPMLTVPATGGFGDRGGRGGSRGGRGAPRGGGRGGGRGGKPGMKGGARTIVVRTHWL